MSSSPPWEGRPRKKRSGDAALRRAFPARACPRAKSGAGARESELTPAAAMCAQGGEGLLQISIDTPAHAAPAASMPPLGSSAADSEGASLSTRPMATPGADDWPHKKPNAPDIKVGLEMTRI